MTRSKAQKQKLYKEVAIVAAGLGVTYGLWKYIIKPKYFSKGEDNNSDLNNLNPSNENNTTTKPGKTTNGSSKQDSQPETKSLDIDKKVGFGNKGDLVYRIQTSINNIANLRGNRSYYDSETKKTISFPIKSDSDFGKTTKSAAKYAFPNFKSKGYVTVRNAREQWSRVAGYYDKSFPQELVNVSNYNDLEKIYQVAKTNKIYDEIFK
jgi:hypothetical protein